MALSPEFSPAPKTARIYLAEIFMCLSVGTFGFIIEQGFESILNKPEGVIYREGVKNYNTYASKHSATTLQIPEPSQGGDITGILIATGEAVGLHLISGKLKGSGK